LDRPRLRPKRTAFGAAFFAFVFMLFLASSTDVLANYFRVSLNLVLWFMRIATLLVPPIVYFFTHRICLEMQGVEGIGKRKRAVVISRTASGEYTSVPSEPRPGDGHVELHPEPVPVHIELEPAAVGGTTGNGADGVRTVNR
jgi:ubiquinol-cytochrome c reductase cytochrome b subunit